MQIAIVGVGLIGGSFALAARQAGIADRITGWDSREVLERACAMGVIDAVEYSIGAGQVSQADLIYLAAPVGAIVDFLRTRSTLTKAGAIITDAGSTKRDICQAASEGTPVHAGFVGGHPMAGSHKSGVEHVDPNLFRGAPYALVANESTQRSKRAALAMEEIVRSIGARPVSVTAEAHDRIVARVSHAPQLLATATACAIAKRDSSELQLAGSGFAEMARLASSAWSVWEDIIQTNSDEVSAALDELIGEAQALKSGIDSGSLSLTGDAFQKANELMGRLNSRAEENEF